MDLKTVLYTALAGSVVAYPAAMPYPNPYAAAAAEANPQFGWGYMLLWLVDLSPAFSTITSSI